VPASPPASLPTVTDAQRRAFRTHGYLVVPGVLDPGQVARGLAAAERLLAEDPPPPGHLGHLARWPRFGPAGHPLLDFYRQARIAELAAALLRPGLALEEPDFAQLAVTVPPWPHRPGHPHLDGLVPPAADGVPGTFTLLAGLWLADQTLPHHGNLWIWPGTHLAAGAYLAEHGADALARPEALGPGPYPPVELGEPDQARGPAGSVVFAHYLLAHNIGGHDGPAGADWRRTLYYRLRTVGHRERWRTCVTDPMHEFR
jgi:Phytanoyl-CoA dioxygenase (PhyH)